MKLTTRLALVVTAFLSFSTLVSGTHAVLVNRSQQITEYKSLLNNISNQLKASDEDDVALALLLTEQSPVAISLVYITNGNEVTYLSENAGSSFITPDKSQLKTGLKQAVQIGNNLERFYNINKEESLGFYISTARIDAQISQTWKEILYFNIVLIFACALLVTVLFRRDSKLNASAKNMQEFIGDASHELKTPLTVIRGYSEMLAKGSGEESKYGQKINEQSLRMNSIIDQLLTIAALDEGKAFQSEEIDIKELVNARLSDVKILQPERAIEFANKELHIKAPRQIVETLIANIVTNAKTHTQVTAPIRATIKGKMLCIEDGGEGLPFLPDKPFQRFDTSRSRETGGSGLGMSLIQKSARALGAKLHFGKSELGGLKVEITF